MAKKRVYELAKELGMQNKELVDWLQAHGYDEVKSHSSSLDDDQAQAVTDKIQAERNPSPAAPPPKGFVVRRRRADIEPTTENAPAAARPAQQQGAPAPQQPERRPAAEPEFRPAVVVRRPPAPAPAGQPAAAVAQQAPEAAAPAAEAATENVAAAAAPEQPEAPAAAAQPEAAEREPAAAAAEAAPSPRVEAPSVPAPQPRTEVQVRPGAPGGAPRPQPRVEVRTPNLPGMRGPNVPVQEGVDPRTLRPTATQAVVISRPLIPIRRVTPPTSTFRPAPAAPGRTAIGERREVRVVPDSMGRGREFIDVTKDKAGQRRRGGSRFGAGPGTPGSPGEPGKMPSKQDLIDLARGRAHIPTRARKRKPTKKGAKTLITTPKESKRVIRIDEAISVSDLSQRLGAKANELIRKLMKMGVMASINQMLDLETAQLLATDYDHTVEKAGYEESQFISEEEDRAEDLKPRPPVVTIMGHVDHGKTSLLDALRSANVADGEAGGITQHIGAYSVNTAKGPVTFLDTPGHEAFTAMRARGAQATDVAVLVVAADDGVMPQTIESINHAKAAEVPVVVAINKMDKPDANPDRVKQMLAEHGLVPEDWGGDTIMVPVSAKAKLNLDLLLENIALQSEVLELAANPDKPAKGIVIESKLEKGRGPVATVLVQEGTLRAGDAVVCGQQYGKLRALNDYRGKQVKETLPGFPVEIIGLSGVPTAGDEFHVVKDIKAAEEVAKNRELVERKKEMAKTSKLTSREELFASIRKSEQKELKVILKADVGGSSEAVAQALLKLSTQKVRVNIIHKAVGAVTESDVNLAKASGALIVGFNVKPESKVQDAAARLDVDVRLYSIIYEAVDDVRLAMEGMLGFLTREKTIGKVEVRQIFSTPKGIIAGSAVTDGKIVRNAMARVFRERKQIHQGKIASLRRFKDDVREVAQGFECGLGFDGFNDLQVGDTLEVFEIEQIRQSL
ncbi:translation initiation factor IF-2 [Vulgatibacter sp.]|uniref:translation initiation factor IF-2 n=1 Tax=Vulgatibacter sp. TaxID=1971226 RepID=UPI0035695642